MAAVPSNRWRPWLLPLASGVAPVPDDRRPDLDQPMQFAIRPDTVAGTRPAGQGLSGRGLRDAFLVHALRAGLPAAAARTGQSRALHVPADLAVDDDAGDPGRAPGPDVGGRRSHDPGQRPQHLLQPQSAVAGSHLEIPADLLGGHRAGAVGLVLPGLFGLVLRTGIDAGCSTTW